MCCPVVNKMGAQTNSGVKTQLVTGPMPSRTLISFLVLVSGAFAQGSSSAHWDLKLPDTLTVGDRFALTVKIASPRGTLVVPPAEDAFGDVVVKEWNTAQVAGESVDTSVFSYLLTTYTPKPCTIPELRFLVPNGTVVDTVRVDALVLPVQSVIPASAGDSMDIRGLRPPLSAGKPSLWWLWALLVAATLAAGGWFLRRWLLSRRGATPEAPPPPPYEEAIEALRTLELRNLVRQGLVQQYVFALSEILKRYIARRFETGAQEFTTEEITAWLRSSPVERSIRAGAEWFFATSDPVKFARWLPDDATLTRMSSEAREFVEKTRPVVQATPTTPASGTTANGGPGGV